uniref:Uncharacterized protein n=1 Tax=Candidatus Caldatribacterium californiense TaxID=1454726 RepID=A0A7V3YLR1_9BACT
MKVKGLLILFLLLAAPTAGVRTFGEEGNDCFYAIQPFGEGYLLAGYTTVPENGEEGWLVKVNGRGEKEWERIFGGRLNQRILDLEKAGDGMVLAGYTSSGGAGWRDFLLIRVSAGGEELWGKTYGTEMSDRAYSVLRTGDGFLLAGQTDTADRGWDAMVVRVLENGEECWRRTYGGEGHECIYKILPAENGWLLAGYTSSGAGGGWLLRIDESGEPLWQKTLGGKGGEIHAGVRIPNGYVLAGFTSGAGGRDVYVARIDENGELEWERTFGGSYDEEGHSIAIVEGGFLVGGWTGSYGEGGYDAYLIKLDERGEEVWSQTFGGAGDEFVQALLPTGKGFLLAGSTSSWGKGGSDGMLLFAEEPKAPRVRRYIVIGAGCLAILFIFLAARKLKVWRSRLSTLDV